MRQQVAASTAPSLRTARTPAKRSKRSPKAELFTVIFSSFVAGGYFAVGLRDRLAARSDDWPIEFLFGTLWLLVATITGIRLLKINKAVPLNTDTDSVLQVTDSAQR
jgi:hypothetical protein